MLLKTILVLQFVLDAMIALVPGKDHAWNALAIARAVTSRPPLFRGDESYEKTAALIVAVAFRESAFDERAVGDHGHSVCMMQIYDGPKELLDDPEACIVRGIDMLRESIRYDSRNPVAFYARGPRYKSEEAQRISRDRMAIAAKIVRESDARKQAARDDE